MKVLLIAILIIIGATTLKAKDSTGIRKTVIEPNRFVYSSVDYKFKFTHFIAPVTLISVGVAGLGSERLKYLNQVIKDELTEEIYRKTKIDNFTQFLPAASVYGLNLLGVKGKNKFIERSSILASSYLLMTICVHALKSTTNVKRPNNTSYNSFPSGHTATAFVGAEFLWQEYKDVSPWIGIAGYSVAAGTGFFRMYNNRHWLTDVLTGAGIGILCTKAAYWSFPKVKNRLFAKKSLAVTTVLVPYISSTEKGLAFQITF